MLLNSILAPLHELREFPESVMRCTAICVVLHAGVCASSAQHRDSRMVEMLAEHEVLSSIPRAPAYLPRVSIGSDGRSGSGQGHTMYRRQICEPTSSSIACCQALLFGLLLSSFKWSRTTRADCGPLRSCYCTLTDLLSIAISLSRSCRYRLTRWRKAR